MSRHRRHDNTAGWVAVSLILAVYFAFVYWYITLPVIAVLGLLWLPLRRRAKVLESQAAQLDQQQGIINSWYTDGNIRATNLDRRLAFEILADSMGQEALTLDEWNERMVQVTQSTYRGELYKLIVDLPN